MTWWGGAHILLLKGSKTSWFGWQHILRKVTLYHLLNLRRSRDCHWLFVRVCLGVHKCVALWFLYSAMRFIYLFWADVTLHINALSIMKVYIKRNNVQQVELIRFRKKIATLLTFETLKWEYIFATDVLIAIRDEAPLVCRGPCTPDVSQHSDFGTCHIGTSTIRDCTTALFQVTMYRQFAWKVGTSANSALIRYHLLRLKLPSLTRDRG